MEASATTALLGDDAVVGAVDYKGRPVSRSATGGWRSALFIIGVEIAERFAYYGIASNLISYLTGPLRQSTAEAAENVNVWSGVSSMLPLLGAFVADSYLGRYRTILLASLLYILGLCLLTLSAMLPSLRPPQCPNPQLDPTSCPTPTRFQIFFFFSALYLVAFAQGGHKPCVQAFGADQFDSRHPKESKSKSSFFNWWYFGLCGGTAISLWILNYIQENVGWGLGFGIPCVSMVVALLVFLLGTSTYRYTSLEERSPFARIGQVFLVAVRRSFAWQGTSSASSARDGGKTDLEGGSSLFKYLDQTVVPTFNGSENEWSTCSSTQVEEAKAVLQLVPIWATCLLYGVVFAQSSTFFTKQGSTMDRSLGPHLQIPAATLQTFISLSIVLVIPFYDRLLVPAARALTGIPSGITMLQRIGFGMFLSIVSMMVAAVVESWRLAIAQDAGLIDRPGEFVPMSVWWLAPQYVLYGIADVFTMVGLQEFFYDQVPEGLRSVGLSLYLSIFGIGSFISGFLISVIDQVTGGGGGESWFATNLNRAHLDYFYWLLAGISALELGLYIYFSKSYVYYVGARLR